jgi:hypothetical protein
MRTTAIKTSASVPTIHAALGSPAAENCIVTIKQCPELRPAFTEAALRDLRFKAFDRKNSRGDVIEGNGSGAAGVWVRIGKRILIDLEAFDAWVKSHKMGSAK